MALSIDLPYFPRPALLGEVQNILTSGLTQGVTLFAPRRQGKTMFVQHDLLPAMEALRWRTGYVDLWRDRTHPAAALVAGVEAAAGKHRHRAARALGAGIGIAPVSLRGKVTFEPAPVATLIERLDVALRRLTRSGPALLVFDEFQALASARESDFVAGLRAVLQAHAARLKLFYTGSSRDTLNRMFRRKKAPLFRSARAVQLPDLGAAFVEDRCAFIAQRTDRMIDASTLGAVFAKVFHTPEFLNQVVLNLVVAGDDDVARAYAAFLADLVANWTGWEGLQLTSIHRAVLTLLQKPSGIDLFSAAAVAQAVQLTGDPHVSAGKIQTAVQTLARHGIVSPTGEPGGYEIDDRALLVLLAEHRLHL